MKFRDIIGAVCLLGVFMLPARAAISFGHIDDFNDGTTRGWGRPAFHTNATDQGISGVPGDHALSVVASGIQDQTGSRFTVYNRSSEWTGDYMAAGVGRISGSFKNDGNEDLEIRIALSSIGGNASADPSITWFSTIASQTLPANGQWMQLEFNIGTNDLVKVSAGLDSVTDVLQLVREIRILASDIPEYRGQTQEVTVLIDNLRAVPEASSGMLLFLGVAALLRYARRVS